ncbi:arginine-tRNA ligase [Pneumocystis carinii B80]|uniref:arginine--tRNA ligase n=1 Tax=Pneumocystis carinii (strain B80) TaxID=1408658 RepID=A0A0W4ZBC8_PNEC8|nr:arginine-tRNA ligase [Pneumocystis carinii B80]KTW25601.1 arginine-tRNA ligase [Pneumocystis carinii B80]
MRNIKTYEELVNELKEFGVSENLLYYEDSNPLRNPFDIFRLYIAQNLSGITGISYREIYPILEHCSKLENGDLMLPVARLRLGENPVFLAKEWSEKFPEKIVFCKHQGAFIQFFFRPEFLTRMVIPYIHRDGDRYGSNESGKGKKVVVEFGSPNIAKPFHAGHLRSTIIGAFVSNIHEFCSWEVIRLNYLGDWGKQFGLLAIGFQLYGSEESLESNPIQHLYDVYVKVNLFASQKDNPEADDLNNKAREYFKRMEEGDETALSIWRRFRDLSIKKYKITYDRLNIRYDEYSGESGVSPESIKMVINSLKEKGFLNMDDGAMFIDLSKYSKNLGKAMLQKRDGTSLYLTRDIGEAINRYQKYEFDKMIYVVSSQQDLHLAQLLKILELLDLPWAKSCMHINYGLVLGMSTRKGTAVFLDSILETAKENMHDVMKKNEKKYLQIEDPEYVSDVIGISAILIQDMSSKRINNYSFDWQRILTFEGDTGPYLQYAHSRLESVIRRLNISLENIQDAKLDSLIEPAAIDLVRLLARYPDVINTTIKTLEPCTIITYLFKLAHTISGCYDVLWVMNQSEDVAMARLSLFLACKRVLSNGMRLLGLTPLERYVVF